MGKVKVSSEGRVPGKARRKKGSRKMLKPSKTALQGSGTKTKGTASRASSRRMSKPVLGTPRATRVKKDGSAMRWQHK